MYNESDVVTLWVVLESPMGAWVGEGMWPVPRSVYSDAELTYRIKCSLMNAILKLVKGEERFSMTVFLSNLAARAIDQEFQNDHTLQRDVAENAEQIAWKQWHDECN